MKEKIFAFLCLMSLLLSGCYEDKGNYDYNNLLKITITGFLSEKEDGTESEITSLTVTAGQVVKVRPILSFENEKDKKKIEKAIKVIKENKELFKGAKHKMSIMHDVLLLDMENIVQEMTMMGMYDCINEG